MPILLFLIGLVCFLLVLGFFFSEDPVKFTIQGLIILGAISFTAFLLITGYAILIGFN